MFKEADRIGKTSSNGFQRQVTPDVFDPAGWKISPSVGLRQGRDEGFGDNFRSTRFQDYDLAVGIVPSHRYWDLRLRYGLHDRDQQTINARTEDLNTDLSLAWRHRIPWIDGADVTFTWNRKTFDTETTDQDLDSNLLRFDMNVPF